MSGVSAEQFKAVMGSFASGVTVVTGVDATGGLCGITVSAFSSLSLDPPLSLICIDRRAASHPVLLETRRFAVNILSDAQEDLSNRFASRIPDKFAGIDWSPGAVTGCPLLGGVLAWMECTLHAVHDGGDHDILVGKLVATGVDPEARPLVYSRGAYGDVSRRERRW